jgi:hypothetical protein
MTSYAVSTICSLPGKRLGEAKACLWLDFATTVHGVFKPYLGSFNDLQSGEIKFRSSQKAARHLTYQANQGVFLEE